MLKYILVMVRAFAFVKCCFFCINHGINVNFVPTGASEVLYNEDGSVKGNVKCLWFGENVLR